MCTTCIRLHGPPMCTMWTSLHAHVSHRASNAHAPARVGTYSPSLAGFRGRPGPRSRPLAPLSLHPQRVREGWPAQRMQTGVIPPSGCESPASRACCGRGWVPCEFERVSPSARLLVAHRRQARSSRSRRSAPEPCAASPACGSRLRCRQDGRLQLARSPSTSSPTSPRRSSERRHGPWIRYSERLCGDRLGWRLG
jgi:hypothetical protein